MRTIFPTPKFQSLPALFACLVILCSCSTPPQQQSAVRKIDFNQAPELSELAEYAREFGNEMYPKICALLLDETARPPRRFDVILKPIKSGNLGQAQIEWKRIELNSDHLTNRTELFDEVMVHEMTHMAVQYRHWIKDYWTPGSPPMGHWGESIADYARFKIIGTNGVNCPECNTRYPHYTSGYRCGGAFLLHLESLYGPNLIRQIVREFRLNLLNDDFFFTQTGRTLDQLWKDFENNSSAFTALAPDAWKLHQALGFTNGLPPKDVFARFEKHLELHGSDFTRQVMQNAEVRDALSIDIHSLVTAYCYFAQAGGSAEEALVNLKKNGELPGIGKDEKGSLAYELNFLNSFNYPATRVLEARRNDDPSLYQFTLSRAGANANWKLIKALRTSADGEVLEEYSLP